MTYSYSYIIEIQYLGFRYSGWAKQPGQKTIHGYIDKTLGFVFDKSVTFKTIGCSRTDALVSAEQNYFQLFTIEQIQSLPNWLLLFNSNLPPDIKGLSIKPISTQFNIIQAAKQKHYQYLFSNSDKPHPFLAPHSVNVTEKLNIDAMQCAAKYFIGKHNFINYCTQPKPNTQTLRTIDKAELVSYPEKLNRQEETMYAFNVNGKGFLRHQIRLMMGQLFELGKGKLSFNQLENSLNEKLELPFETIAPASGLTLQTVIF